MGDISEEEAWGASEDVTRSFTSSLTPAFVDQDRAHYMVVVKGLEPGKRIEIGDEPIVIGRKRECDLRLRDEKVSGTHCRISLISGQTMVTDLHSTNGTLIDGARIDGVAVWAPESTLQVGTHVLRHEYRSRREVEQTEQLSDELKEASSYVQSLLPPPIKEGPITTDWCFMPCSLLGGDAFGYHKLRDDRLAMYLLDVSGHGAGSAS